MRCFRMNPASEDPQRLLAEEAHWTEPWGDSRDGAPCDKCDGKRTAPHTCWACELTGADPECPACGGAVRWEAECPVCRGTGRVDGKPRHGVSVFGKLEGLYHYMLDKGADLDDCVIVESESERSGDVDFDADQGAILVIPTAILGCSRVDRDLMHRVEGRQ
jgi:RecJ-like exonuclease